MAVHAWVGAEGQLRLLPAALPTSSPEARAALEREGPEGRSDPLAVVLGQEVARFNRLHQVVQQTLQGLVEALQGHTAMTPELLSVHHALITQQVLASVSTTPEFFGRIGDSNRRHEIHFRFYSPGPRPLPFPPPPPPPPLPHPQPSCQYPMC